VHAPARCSTSSPTCGGAVETLAGCRRGARLRGRPSRWRARWPSRAPRCWCPAWSTSVDADAERARLQKIIEAKSKQVAGFEGRLGNEGFLANAKPEVVDHTRALLAEAEADLAAAQAALTNLS
jgi:hypothetical protein